MASLQNAEHLEFNIGVKRDIDQHIAGNPLGQFARDIEPLFTVYKKSINGEDDAYKLIAKSAVTRLLGQLDVVRDGDWSGISGNINLLVKHFNKEIADAAYRVKVEFDGFGNIARKSYDAETTDITNVIQSLRGKLAADVAILGLTEWVDRLEASNLAFIEAAEERYEEKVDKNALGQMRTARLATDGDYRSIVERINAGIIYNGPQQYEAFVNDINVRIKHYNDIIARRKGVNAAKKDKNEGGEE